jgi:hypothetical protein
MKVSLPVAEPHTTTIARDPQGNPLTITDTDNKVTTLTYNVQVLLLTTKDALNNQTTFTYNAQGVPSACPVEDLGSTRQSFSPQPSRFLCVDPDYFIDNTRFPPSSVRLLVSTLLIQSSADTPRRTTAFRFTRYPASPYPAIPRPALPQTH